MPVNLDKPHLWKADIARSIDFYNHWFINFAPSTFRESRLATTRQVEYALHHTQAFSAITPQTLAAYPAVLQVLRMATAPPLARDRLAGLAGIKPTLIKNMEIYGRLPKRMPDAELDKSLANVCALFDRLVDPDLFPWLATKTRPSDEELHRVATVVADRLTGAVADPILRNAQEKRQLETLGVWLEQRGYTLAHPPSTASLGDLPAGTYAIRFNVPIHQTGRQKSVNIPIDALIVSRQTPTSTLPLLIEAKSAGDFTNTNKRRKEEATKVNQLRATYGPDIRFALLLCGYFDTGYLGYEAAEGIDWIWEHRIEDLVHFGI